MKFIFIRHSKTDRNPQVPITCWGLAEEGVELAKELSQKQVIKDIDVMYASFQTKALETAVLLAKPNAIPIKANDGLTEVTSFTGPFEPDFDLYTKNVHDFYSDNLDRIAGGETKAEALERFVMTLESIAKAESNKDFVGIITHGNILTLFSVLYKDVDCYELHSTIKQPDVAIFDWNKKTFDVFFGEEPSAKIIKDTTLKRGVNKMAKYVDGFVLVVPRGKEAEYEEMARMGRDSWMKHGALQYFECRGDDLKQQEMGNQKSRAYGEMTDASKDENVWFSFIVFNSKEHRDEVNRKVMDEMSETFKDQANFEMPNDITKMAYGGFEVAVEG